MKLRNVLGYAVLIMAMACGKSGSDGPDEPTDPPVSENKTEIKAGETVKVMAYNIHHANPPSVPNLIDINAIAAVINRERPDIVALQEVDVRTRRSGTTLDQAQTLASRTGMHVFFSKSIDYQGGEYGNAILSRYPIVHRVRHDLPIAPGAPSNTEARSVAVIAVAAEGGGRVYFASTHLEVSDMETRNLQVDRLREINTALNTAFIIGGDFNAQMGSETINRFTAGNMFRVACIGGCPHTIPATNPNRAIDFVFLNQQAQSNFTVTHYDTVAETYASDHRPVVATMRYEE